MGWASGSAFADDIWAEVRPFIPAERREELAKRIMAFFIAEDADAWSQGTPDSPSIADDAKYFDEPW